MRLSVDGRSVAYFFYFLFSRVDKGVSDDFVLRLKMRLKNSFSVAKSHSTFAAQFRIKFMIAEVVKAAASRTTLITI